jgi:hypothetical protein
MTWRSGASRSGGWASSRAAEVATREADGHWGVVTLMAICTLRINGRAHRTVSSANIPFGPFPRFWPDQFRRRSSATRVRSAHDDHSPAPLPARARLTRPRYADNETTFLCALSKGKGGRVRKRAQRKPRSRQTTNTRVSDDVARSLAGRIRPRKLRSRHSTSRRLPTDRVPCMACERFR